MANLQKIKTLAEQKGITIKSLAESVGLKENQIHFMCRANTTKITTLESIAAALGVPVNTFFDDAPAPLIHDESQNRTGDTQLLKLVQTGEAAKELAREEADEICDLKREIEHLREVNDALRSQLADKERIIKLYERESNG